MPHPAPTILYDVTIIGGGWSSAKLPLWWIPSLPTELPRHCGMRQRPPRWFWATTNGAVSD